VGLGNSAFANISHATSPKQVWPLADGTNDILHTFGSPLNFGGFRYFHDGVDISVDGNAKHVVASRGGIVTDVNNNAGGMMDLDVDFGAGPEGDWYLHTNIDPTWAAGNPIAPGEEVGTVNINYFLRAPEADHLHWGDAHIHNLLPFTSNADRDPNSASPIVSDINNDGKDFIVVSATNNNHASPREPAWGDVDFIVDASDDMSANMNLVAAPFEIGYWIQSIIPGGENVRTPAAPYKLLRFDFPLHHGDAAHALENNTVYWNLNADIFGINTWQTCFSWILTNTRGTDGATANVDAAQFWRTDARKVSGAEPNGSDAQHARENQEAKFPDGTYNVHIILDDLVHESDQVRTVVIDNSRPTLNGSR